MRTRLYVLTHEVMLGNDKSAIHQDRTPEEIEKSALHAVNLLHARSTIYGFTSLKDAKKYVKESRSYRLLKDETDEYDYYPHGERAIVEIFIDSSTKSQWKLKTEKVGTHKEYIDYIKQPREPDKLHPFYEIPNRPEMYVCYRAWINLKEFHLHNKPPASYKKITSKHADEIRNISELFHDYHSPKFFSCHWRHHKKLARRIENRLAQLRSFPEVYDFLFQERQHLIQTYKDLDLLGSFMRRIEYALKKIRDVEGKTLEETRERKFEFKIG